MIPYPNIDPVAIAIGPLKVHWYGLMYVFALTAGWWLCVRKARRPDSLVQANQVEDMVFYCAMGIILGGRLGYVIFYGFDQFLADPIWLFKVWQGGMAFHGGFIGVVVAMCLYARKTKINPFDWLDFLAPVVPLGLAFGRIGNFIGGELYGRAGDVPWAMVFPTDPEQIARHPSQLYQAGLEGLTLFLVLMWFGRKPRPRFAVSGLFALGYGIFRFIAEFFRQPDAHLGFDLFDWMTRGQLLSLPMILIGMGMLVYAYKMKPNTEYK